MNAKKCSNWFLFLGFTLWSVALCAQEEMKSDPVFKFPISKSTLPNGLQVVTVPYDSPGLVSFYIIMRVGSRDEVEKGKSGFAHFFEHMMFRGTEKYSKEKYDQVLKSFGASANANTWLDRTVYHMTGNALMLDKMFELESDRFMNLKYSIQDFKTEAGAVKGEYTKNFSNPFVQLDEKTNFAAFTKHTYQHTTMGFWDDVVDMPRQYDYSLDFFKKFYRPEYATILVVGDVKSQTVEELSKKYFGSWVKGNFVSQVPVEPTQETERYVHLSKDGVPPVLVMSYKTPSFLEKPFEVAALDVLSSYLFSERSDLYRKLVFEVQKCRNLEGELFFTRDPYLMSVSATLKSATDIPYVRDEINKAIEKVISEGVNEKILAEIKLRIRNSFSMGLNSPDGVARSLSYFIWVTNDPESLNRTYDLYQKVSSFDLKTAAKNYLVRERLVNSTISPESKSPFVN